MIKQIKKLNELSRSIQIDICKKLTSSLKGMIREPNSSRYNIIDYIGIHFEHCIVVYFVNMTCVQHLNNFYINCSNDECKRLIEQICFEHLT